MRLLELKMVQFGNMMLKEKARTLYLRMLFIRMVSDFEILSKFDLFHFRMLSRSGLVIKAILEVLDQTPIQNFS